MTKDKPPEHQRVLSTEDQKLWDHMAKDFEPLRKSRKKHVIVSETVSDVSNKASTPTVKKDRSWKSVDVDLSLGDNPIVKGQDVDGRTAKRLKQGKMDIEGVLDLHGMVQEEAHKALLVFIRQSYSQGKRCVLIITGKGRRHYPDQQKPRHFIDPEPGVLKRRVPDWLRDKSLSSMILQWEQARPSDGGDGALYVLLRRHRVK